MSKETSIFDFTVIKRESYKTVLANPLAHNDKDMFIEDGKKINPPTVLYFRLFHLIKA